MLTTLPRYGHLCLIFCLAVLLAACTARPVLHEFPPGLALPARAPAAVNYTLQLNENVPGRWELLGGQGASIGVFQWQASSEGADPGVVRVTDSVNGNVYRLRLLNDDRGAPRVIAEDAQSGRRVGDLELRIGFHQRVEGVWRDRSLLWQIEHVPANRVRHHGDDGRVEDVYPAAEVLQWIGGSDAGVRAYSGRRVAEGPRFGARFYDVMADRPLARSELGDLVVMLLAITGLQMRDAAEQE